MTEEDGLKEGGYGLADFREAWRDINGADAWDSEKVVDVIEFTYGGRTRKEAKKKANHLRI